MEGDVDRVDVTSCVSVYLSALVTNRRVLFWAISNLYLIGKIRELIGTVESYMRAGRMVVQFQCVSISSKSFIKGFRIV